MNKILLGHHGRYGDICIGIPTFEVLKQLYPNCKYFLNIHKDYQDIAPLFFNNKNIDGIFISDEYQKFPNKLDEKNIKEVGFDMIFNPMQPRIDEPSWWMHRHQVEDVAYQYGLPLPSKKIVLNKWFDYFKRDKFIAFHATPANYDKNNKKSFTRQKSQELVDSLIKLGYFILQVGARSDEKLQNVVKVNTDFFESVKNILGCDLFIGGDSGLTWALSGYNFPVLATYSNEYYIRDNVSYLYSIQPINPNAQYLDAPNVNDIPNELIIDKIKEMI